MGDFAKAINEFVQAIANNATVLVGAMAAVGVLSMAIIQTIKDMFPLRNAYQRVYLRNWLNRKADAAMAIGGTRPDPVAAEQDLTRLATAGDDKALYDLPIEQMCGQISAALQVVLDYPAAHPDLLRCMAALADSDDIKQIVAEQSTQTPRPQPVVDARTRVTHQIQRTIDSFQITAGYRWKLYLQIASFALSFLITVLAMSTLKEVPIALILLVGIVGGFLAPVARDLLAALQKLRT